MTTMQAIRAELQHLLAPIEKLRTTAERIGSLTPTEAAAAHRLAPHR